MYETVKRLNKENTVGQFWGEKRYKVEVLDFLDI